MTAYRLLVTVHRYAGLAIAVFVSIAGLTGSVIAFHQELDAWLNPTRFNVAPGVALPPSIIAQRVEAADPRVRAAFVETNVEPGRSVLIWIEPRTDSEGTIPDVGYNQVFVDPSTG